ncbi:MAG: glycosyltransferase family 4 protein [Thermoleophilia bacterium]
MSKRNIAIYLPSAAGLFRRSVGSAGGAERQMTLLAAEMASRNHTVGFVVYDVKDPIPDREPGLTLVQRRAHASTGGLAGIVIEAFRVIRSLLVANGRLVVVRGGTPVVGFIALYCFLRRRQLVFSSANDFDFLPQERFSKFQSWLYSFGVRKADTVVVQSSDQVELAKKAYPTLRKLIHIPSFADDPPAIATRRNPTAFIWAGRLVDYKRPLLFVELAAALPGASFLLIPHVTKPPKEWEVDALAELAAAVAKVPNLELGGGLPHAELIVRLADAVAVVNTSEFEGMPNIFLEAWGQGVPALTFSVDPGGVVAEKGLGIAAGGSWEAFVDGARMLWETRFDQEELAERTRAYLRATHSRKAVGTYWEELFQSLGAFDDRSQDGAVRRRRHP